MTSSLTGKTALVTGGSKGIGAGIATDFALAGATVVLTYASDRAGADEITAAITARGGRAWAVQGDVSKPEDVKRVLAEVGERHERLDVLVNNAGVYEAAPLGEVTVEQFDRLFSVNVLGLLLMTQAALKLFGPTGGSIINIGALSGRMGSPGLSVYAGTKGALDAITLSLSKELGPRRIRVNAINPGAVETEGVARSGFLEARRDMIVASTPLGRVGQPEDIARIAEFLASDAAGWVNGQILFAAGGLTY
jgi:3-oxoacyl-[acyl-carrier protein] reductase